MALQHSQNFLHSRRLVREMVAASSLSAVDHVYEIGPGRGIITSELARRCRRVDAIEADTALVAELRRRFAGDPHVHIRNGDVLRDRLPRGPFKVFANLPFNRTAAIMRLLFAGRHPPTDAYLILQREAAAKYAGFGRRTLLSTVHEPWYVMEKVRSLARSDFRPRPGVETVLLRVLPRRSPPIPLSARGEFADLVAIGFCGKRKNLQNNLRGLLGRRQFRRLADDLGFHAQTLASGLTSKQWHALFDYVRREVCPRRRAIVAGAFARAGRPTRRGRS